MYSGTTLTKFSGRLLGAHQKIDRVARKHLKYLLPDNSVFPDVKHILQFEGKNGPDGIKRKSPARDEPWHFFNPFDESDSQILEAIQDHYDQLVHELKTANLERAAFEAAWLAHALVDGLTPAHHFPYEEKLAELRDGTGNASRTSLKEKLMMHGDTPLEKLRNNWKMWGSKGLMMTHGSFEIGIAALMAPLSFIEAVPSTTQISELEQIGIKDYFRRTAQEIARLGLYDSYYHKGWTPRLAFHIRHKLGPTVIQTVTLVWYMAARDARLAEPAA